MTITFGIEIISNKSVYKEESIGLLKKTYKLLLNQTTVGLKNIRHDLTKDLLNIHFQNQAAALLLSIQWILKK
jgi:hypothetical protein